MACFSDMAFGLSLVAKKNLQNEKNNCRRITNDCLKRLRFREKRKRKHRLAKRSFINFQKNQGSVLDRQTTVQ